MTPAAVIFHHYSNDDVTRRHLELIRQHNPGMPVVALHNDSARTHVEGSHNVDRLDRRWTNERPWRGSDTMIYRAHAAGILPDAARFILLESDTLTTVPLAEWFAPVWDADLAAAEIVRPEVEPQWHWFRQTHLLPPRLRPHRTGVRPGGVLLWSRRCLDAVCAGPIPPGIFSELRIGTLAVAAGFNPVELPEHVAAGITYSPNAPRGDSSRPGVFHPVKHYAS